ncbi:siderophore-interacting protein [Brevibacterium sp.]|uniref:siderophore-interacting protein n=1 Tax=Brevibacterium sp. TaxID=1701 RepID=UPI0025B95720|nr:siderophore-interacting protein [Brevibacterium sp.]
MSLHDLRIHPLVVRTVTVAAVEDVTPRMRRIRLTGEELGAFTRDGHAHPPFSSPGFDDHVKLVLARGGPLETALPLQLPDGIEWTPAPHRETRDYTPRSFDPEAGELVLDFVMHGDGPAATWARDAAPGDPLTFVGPKSSLVLPADATALVLVGDETALPALGRFFDERPLPAPAHVLAFAADPAAHQPLALGPEDSVRWEHMPHPDGEAIARSFDELVEDRDLGERPYVWAAGEASSLLPLRRRLSGLVARGDRSITGYWHRTEEAEAAAVAPALPEAPAAWFAIRAALDLGLLPVLSAGARTADGIAAALGVPHVRLRPLLDALVPSGLLERDDAGAWRLSALGRDLLDDPHAQEEFTGPEAAQILALAHTAEAVRGGTPAWELAHGTPFARTLADPATAAHLAHEAESLAFLQYGLVRRLAELDAHSLLAVGPAAGVLAEVAARGGIAVRPLAAGEERTPAPEASPAAATDGGTVIVSALLLHHLDDAAALAHLRTLAAHASRALLLDSPAPDALSPDAALRTLVQFGTSGTPPRTPADVAALAQEAGWTALSARGLGWGLHATELVRG